MDLHEVTRVLRKRLSWLAAAAVTGLVLSALWTFTRTPLYQAVTQIEVVGGPGGHIARSLQHRQTHQRLHPAHKSPAGIERVFVNQRDGF